MGTKPETAATVILCDVSGSMAESNKVQQLRDKLRNIWGDIEKPCLLAFASDVVWVEKPEDIPPPCGGTALHIALKAAAEFQPMQVIVISDGFPDNAELAAEEAAKLPGTVTCVFTGDDRYEIEGKTFLHKLARDNGGQFYVRDLRQKQFEATMRDLLGLPAPLAM